MTDEYGMPDGYTARDRNLYFEDPFGADDERGEVWQQATYALAVAFAEAAQVLLRPDVRMTFADVGCGNGAKAKRVGIEHPDWRVMGFDQGPNVRKAQAAGVEAYDVNLDVERELHLGDAVVVCADVIEHLLDPRPLLRVLGGCGARAVVVSTPARERVYGERQIHPGHLGPPVNNTHVREWASTELPAFIEGLGVPVRWHGLLPASSRDSGYSAQVVVL